MILDLIVILLVIVLSYLLCMDTKHHNCQLSHIVIGLTIIVFYKFECAIIPSSEMTHQKSCLKMLLQ